MLHAWFDVSAGVAGDMLLGALLDAGAPVAGVQEALEALVPGSVRLETETVTRGGQRATKARVRVLVDDPPHRTWASVRAALQAAPLAATTREAALAAFGRLADAEARAHGIDPDEVHFHEVGALDSIADVVGVCEALRLLGVQAVSASPVAVGAGRVRTAHGDLPVPVPAVAELVRGWRTTAVAGVAAPGHHPHDHAHPHHDHSHHDHPHDHAHHHHDHSQHDHPHEHTHHHHDHEHHDHPHPGQAHDAPAVVTTPGEVGELATPTGLALVRALASRCEGLPGLTVTEVGIGAGGRDFASHPNVVRVVLGEPTASAADETLVEVRANVDDMDPRLWPGVIDACLAAGAVDAWLVPITMKKGRPAHTLYALAREDAAAAVTTVILTHTTTLGVRQSPVTRTVLDREQVELDLDGHPLEVKVARRGGVILHAAAEFESLARVASHLGRPQAEVAQRAAAAIVAGGLIPPSPPDAAR